MKIEEFSLWIIISISLTVSILILNIWYIFFKNQNGNTRSPVEKTDYGLLFLSFALPVWGFSGLINQLHILDTSIGQFTRSVFSSLNNFFLLMGASYLKYSPKYIREKTLETHNLFRLLTIVDILLAFMLWIFGFTSIYFELPSFLFSLFTILILGYSLFMTFWKRRLLIIACFSIAILLIVLAAQPIIHFFAGDSGSDFLLLLNLFSRLSFIIIICLLAYSHAQLMFGNAQQEVITLVDSVNNLEQEKKSIEEAVSRDERDAAWQDIAMKAAHKIGNPIEAIDKLNKILLRKLHVRDVRNARVIQSQIHDSVNDAIYVLSEFKSLNKLIGVKPLYCDLVKIIKQACKNQAQENIVINISVLNKKMILSYFKQTDNVIGLREDETVDLYVDRDKIKQCFIELIANSIHFFNKKDKIISITLEFVRENIPSNLKKNQEYIKIVYMDNGIGIRNDMKKNIFNPFVTTYQHGSGLGLAIVNRIIELHKGMIFENGKYEEGARFEIYLPSTR